MADKTMTVGEVKAGMVAIARENFYAYCHIRLPQVYKPDRKHLQELCTKLQAFFEDKLLDPDGNPISLLIINMPPRHGKTLTVEMLVEWALGRKPETAIMVACYNEELSGRFGKTVRNDLSERALDPMKITYGDIFPKTKIKQGDASFSMWSIEGRHFSFLATSPGASATGFGASMLIVDDLCKNASEAMNERVLEGHWDWYNNTMRSRLEARAKQINIQTRWSTKDLTGRLLDHEGEKWYVISMPAFNEAEEAMLCDDIFSRETYEELSQTLDPVIFQGNYQQRPFDSIDKLYRQKFNPRNSAFTYH